MGAHGVHLQREQPGRRAHPRSGRPINNRARELGFFTLFGTTGTAINLTVVAMAVPLGWAPLVANVAGFVVAFAWCFFGHSRWTFPAEGRDVAVAARRFAIVSVLGFGLNEAAYAAVLEWASIDYRLSLFLVILTLSLLKLLASKHWAFASERV